LKAKATAHANAKINRNLAPNAQKSPHHVQTAIFTELSHRRPHQVAPDRILLEYANTRDVIYELFEQLLAERKESCS